MSNFSGIILESDENTKINYILSSYFTGYNNITTGELRISDHTFNNSFLTLNTNGNIGIGKPNASESLELSGNMQINNKVVLKNAILNDPILYNSVSGDFTKHIVTTQYKIYVSTDSGVTYNLKLTINDIITAVHISKDGLYMAVAYGNNFIESTNDGNTWSSPVAIFTPNTTPNNIIQIRTTTLSSNIRRVYVWARSSTFGSLTNVFFNKTITNSVSGSWTSLFLPLTDRDSHYFAMSDDGNTIIVYESYAIYIASTPTPTSSGNYITIATDRFDGTARFRIRGIACDGTGNTIIAYANEYWYYSLNRGSTWSWGGEVDAVYEVQNYINRIIMSNDNTKLYIEQRRNQIYQYTLNNGFFDNKFPAGPLTSNTTTINGRTYVASASSVYLSDNASFGPFKAFTYNTFTTNNTTNYWHSEIVYANGIYNGSISTNVSGTVHNGEWLQIDLGTSTYINQIYMWPRTNFNNRYPKEFLVVGSNNNSTWTNLLQTNNSNTVVQIYFTLANPGTYRYYRIIVKSLFPGTGSDSVQLSQVILLNSRKIDLNLQTAPEISISTNGEKILATYGTINTPFRISTDSGVTSFAKTITEMGNTMSIDKVNISQSGLTNPTNSIFNSINFPLTSSVLPSNCALAVSAKKIIDAYTGPTVRINGTDYYWNNNNLHTTNTSNGITLISNTTSPYNIDRIYNQMDNATSGLSKSFRNTANTNTRPTLNTLDWSINFDGSKSQYIETNTNDVALQAGDDTYTYIARWNGRPTSNIGIIYEQNGSSNVQHERSAIIIWNNGTYGFNGDSNDANQFIPYTPNTETRTIMTVNNFSPGLSWVHYNSYFNDDPTFFDTTSPSGIKGTRVLNFTNLTNSIGGTVLPSSDNFSIQWLGYFKADETGIWTFYTESDDASYVWLGQTAQSGYLTTNAIVNNGGFHAMTERSGTIQLVANTYYFIRIQYGEAGGGEDFNFSFAAPGGSRRYDGTGYLFQNLPSSTNIRAYSNKILYTANTSNPEALNVANHRSRLGAKRDNSEYFNGKIHEVMVFTDVLPDSALISYSLTESDFISYSLELSSDSAAKPGSSTWTVSSDERLKTNITLANLETCYNTVKSIPLKKFTWRDDVYSIEQVSDRSKLGWIAQDVEVVFPKAVTQKQMHGLPDCRDLNSDQLIASMYGCIQKLIIDNEELEEEINKENEELELLEKQIKN